MNTAAIKGHCQLQTTEKHVRTEYQQAANIREITLVNKKQNQITLKKV